MERLTALQMIEKARTVLYPRKLSNDNSAGDVACALLTSEGNLFFGVCIDVGSGIGFCAEPVSYTHLTLPTIYSV